MSKHTAATARDGCGWRFSAARSARKSAQRHFRHKTYKQPFGRWLNWILWLQIIVATPLLFPQTRAAIAEFLRTW